MGYVQGMTYPAIILIPVVGKLSAFTIFSNLVLGNSFFRRLFTLESSVVSEVTRAFEELLR